MADEKNNSPQRRTLDSLLARIPEIRARKQQLAKDETLPVAPVPKKAVVQLPLWPEVVRGVPNAFLRSSLFGISPIRKIHQRRTVIAAVDGYEVRFKGESFNQTDLDVWEMLLHLARLQPLGVKVEFTAYSLLKELGRSTGGKDHEQLKEELARLGSGWTEITDTKAKKTFAGNFIGSFVRGDEAECYIVTFNPATLKLYESGYTLIDWEQRLLLGRNSLAKWLHGQYATHAKPFAYRVETLRDLSGSTTTVKAFKQALKKALDALKAVGVILKWSIDEHDLVHVVRSPSRAQLKYLQKKKS